MKKAYLDELYAHLYMISKEIQILRDTMYIPRQDNDHDTNNKAIVRTEKIQIDWLEGQKRNLNLLIQAYIDIHTKS